MAILTGSWAFDAAIALISIFSSIYLYFQHSYKHWGKLKIPHTTPKFPFGDLGTAGLSQSPAEVLDKIYNSFRGEKIVGTWSLFFPILIVRDLDIVRDILVKEFMSFHDRGVYVNEKVDPLSGHLFSIGGSKWKNLRAKLSPTFTSGKMKMMFHILVDQSAQLNEVLNEMVDENQIIEMKEMLARFTTDVISSAAFGLDTNSLRNPDAIFRKMGKKVIEPSLSNALRALLFTNPTLSKLLNARATPKDASDFFLNAVRETMDYREKNNIKKNDFLQLLIQLKNKGEIEDVDEAKSGNKEKNENKTVQKFTFEEAAAQAFIFFVAGFETSSTTMQFALYEMALHPDMQEKTREEVMNVLKKHNGEITYEAIYEMEYLGRFVDETLRKYPAAPFLLRECTREYKVPDTDLVIPKGTILQIPIFSIQRDPKNYPDPLRFDPDRFTEEVKSTRHNYAYLPFGDGPRNCIGMRFGLMQTKVGLVRLLSNFKFEICNESPVPLKFEGRSGILAPKGGMHLKVSKLK